MTDDKSGDDGIMTLVTRDNHGRMINRKKTDQDGAGEVSEEVDLEVGTSNQNVHLSNGVKQIHKYCVLVFVNCFMYAMYVWYTFLFSSRAYFINIGLNVMLFTRDCSYCCSAY